MRAVTFYALPALSALLALLTACSTPGSGPGAASGAAKGSTPAYLNAATGCAVVAGGAIGSKFADPKVAAFWDRVNASVTTELHDRLVLGQYKTVKLIVPTEEAASNAQVVMAALASNRCNHLLQVSHTIDEDSAGQYFRFDVAVMRLAPKGDRQPGASGTNVTTVGEFARAYRFSRTPASFESFYTGTFAETVLADLKQSGALEKLR
jgi:hypothetical protein